ncbi:MAG: TatD DNase family protein [Candidatus Berkelbacteria bacterium Athens1014_28]|uniref:TatD DNase family protein n=1 Tax=Candidatus Berkelbacteria bacterium Athens1014_28 TaxID=2017145 RepID=A0A554LLC6_9BACT|nr:MAG: TatD DNase family protein [Candidatus Berkelbacteria bacterium Athens1014_28]
MFIDTHAHLDFPDFKNEVHQVLGRAIAVDVRRILNVGVDVDSSKKSVDLARKYPEVFAAVGIHPHSALDLDIEAKQKLFTLANHSKVVAIGECGLDYYYLKRSSKFSKYPNREQQIFCFEQMIDLSIELRLPLIVHCREAESDVYAILKSCQKDIRGVLHCFSSDWEFAKKILEIGMAISFTGNITFGKDSEIERIIKELPLGSLMIETDCPYLTPEPFRGKRNEPANVIKVAEKIAEIKNISLSDVERQTTKKAMGLFGIK